MKTPFLTHPALSAGFLSRLNDGEVTGRELAEFEAHRAECADCDAAAGEYEAVLELYRAAGTRDEDPGLTFRLKRKLDARLVEPARVNFLPVRLDVAWAAILIVALAAGLLLRGVILERARREEDSRILVADRIKPLSPGRPAVAPSPPGARIVVEDLPAGEGQGLVVPSRIVSRPPDDSSWAAWTKASGTGVAVLRIAIGADGGVTAAEIVMPETRHGEDALILDAVLRWRYRPERRNGAAVAATAMVRLRGPGPRAH